MDLTNFLKNKNIKKFKICEPNSEFTEDYDAIISIGIVDKLPKEKEKYYINHIVKNSNDYIIMGWSNCKFDNKGKIQNRRNETYITNLFKEFNFFVDSESENLLRKDCESCLLRKSLYVFRKKDTNHYSSSEEVEGVVDEEDPEDEDDIFLLARTNPIKIKVFPNFCSNCGVDLKKSMIDENIFNFCFLCGNSLK